MSRARPIAVLLAAAALAGMLAGPAVAAPPPNDAPDAAKPVPFTTATAQVAGDTTEATNTGGEPLDSRAFDHTIWFEVQVPRDGKLVADTCASSLDTVVAIYTKSGLIEQGIADDAGPACPNPRSTYFGLDVFGPTTYLIAVGHRKGVAGGPVTLRLRYDDQPPTAELTSGPPALTNESSATFTFRASPQPGEQDVIAGVECGLDTIFVTGCALAAPGTLRLDNLSEGDHTLLFRALDAAGNGSTVRRWNWTIDRTPPEIRIVAAPSGLVGNPTAVVDFESERSAHFECSVDGGARAPCTPPLTLPGLAPGPHSVLVTAIDAAGNRAFPASASWRVDDPDAVTATSKPLAKPRAAGTVVARWARRGGGTRVRALRVAGIARGATVTLRCSGPGCPIGKRSLRASRKGTLDVTRLIGRATLRRGAELVVMITQAKRAPATVRFRVGAPGTTPTRR